MKVATKRRVTGRRVRGPAKAREGVGSVEVLPSGRFRVRVWVEGQKKGDTFATREEAEQQRATLAVMHRAVAVLEGGPLRMRHAVELAGLVMEAAEVTGERMTG